MIQALAPNRSDDALDVGSLPRRARSREYFFDTQDFHLLHEVSTEDPISIAQQIAWSGIPGKCLHHLLGGPFGGWMGGHVELEDTAPIRASIKNTYSVVEDGGPLPHGWDSEEGLRSFESSSRKLRRFLEPQAR